MRKFLPFEPVYKTNELNYSLDSVEKRQIRYIVCKVPLKIKRAAAAATVVAESTNKSTYKQHISASTHTNGH